MDAVPAEKKTHVNLDFLCFYLRFTDPWSLWRCRGRRGRRSGRWWTSCGQTLGRRWIPSCHWSIVRMATCDWLLGPDLQWGHRASALLRVLKRKVSWQWAQVTRHIPGTLGSAAGTGGEGARLMIRLQFGLNRGFRRWSAHYVESCYLGQAILWLLLLQMRRQLQGQRTYFRPGGAFLMGVASLHCGHLTTCCKHKHHDNNVASDKCKLITRTDTYRQTKCNTRLAKAISNQRKWVGHFKSAKVWPGPSCRWCRSCCCTPGSWPWVRPRSGCCRAAAARLARWGSPWSRSCHWSVIINTPLWLRCDSPRAGDTLRPRPQERLPLHVLGHDPPPGSWPLYDAISLTDTLACLAILPLTNSSSLNFRSHLCHCQKNLKSMEEKLCSVSMGFKFLYSIWRKCMTMTVYCLTAAADQSGDYVTVSS